MEMTISVFFDHVLQAVDETKRPLQEILQEIKNGGVQCMDVCFDHVLQDPQLPHTIAQAGLCINNVYGFYDWGGEEADDLTRFEKHLLCAQQCQAASMLVVPGLVDGLETFTKDQWLDEVAVERLFSTHPQIGSMTRTLQQAAKRTSKACKIPLCIEDFDQLQAPYAHMYGMLWFFRHVPQLQCLFDTGNFYYSDESSVEALTLLESYVIGLHCKDRGTENGYETNRHCRGLRAVAVGDGYVPIAPMLHRLMDHGFAGSLSIEHYGLPGALPAILSSAAFLRDAIASYGTRKK